MVFRWSWDDAYPNVIPKFITVGVPVARLLAVMTNVSEFLQQGVRLGAAFEVRGLVDR